MVDYGHVVQVAPRKGRRLGSMAAMLGRHHNPHDLFDDKHRKRMLRALRSAAKGVSGKLSGTQKEITRT